METTYEISTISSCGDIELCWEVVSLLRPHLDKNNFSRVIKQMMETEKYHIAGILHEGKCIAFAGYRHMTSLHSGNIIYIDDLCTLESYRGKGLGSELLDHIKGLALSDKMDAVVLDTDFNNNAAQKVYLRSGYKLAALHLACRLK